MTDADELTYARAQLHGMFSDAAAYALDAHREQLRKGTDIAYGAHLLAVAALVVEHGGSTEQATAAVLHDVVEDQGGAPMLREVRARFGEAVADMVAALSDTTVEDRGDKEPWKQRKETYLAHLREAAANGGPEVLVSLCDKVHNSESIVTDATDEHGPGPGVYDRFSAPDPSDAAWYYRELLAAYEQASALPHRLLGRLRTAVETIERTTASAPT